MRTHSVATGTGVVPVRESPLDCLQADCQRAQTLVDEQEKLVEKLCQQYSTDLDKLPAEQLQDAKAAIVLSQDRLEVYRASLAGKRMALDAAFGQRAQFTEQQKLEADFVDATTRLNAARKVIEELKAEQRTLPDRLSTATREFNQALQNWNERKAARDALTGC
jgi:chromosome segregation ATPase